MFAEYYRWPLLSPQDNPALTVFPNRQIWQFGRATAQTRSNPRAAATDRQVADGLAFDPPVMTHVQAKRPSSLKMIDCRVSAQMADHEARASKLWRFTALLCEVPNKSRVMNHQNVCGALLAKHLWLAGFDPRPNSFKEHEGAKFALAREEFGIGRASRPEVRMASLFAFWLRREATNDACHLKDVPDLDVFVRARTQDTSQAQVKDRLRTRLRADFTREAVTGPATNALHVPFGPSSHFSQYLRRALQRTARRRLFTGPKPLPRRDHRRRAYEFDAPPGMLDTTCDMRTNVAK